MAVSVIPEDSNIETSDKTDKAQNSDPERVLLFHLLKNDPETSFEKNWLQKRKSTSNPLGNSSNSGNTKPYDP